MNYYNEFDPYAAQWLRNLIKAGHIPAGDVDDRSITDVCARDLKGYTQCHFFAGIGGWSRALQLAGFPTDRQVWTGSCPCQPFSVAGKGKGTDDERHLWPVWSNLIKECQPSVIFGEQVAAAIAHGWIDGVFADLENEDYACAAAIIPACSVGAPHRRERLWFVAHSESESGRSGESTMADAERSATAGRLQCTASRGESDVGGQQIQTIRGIKTDRAGDCGDSDGTMADATGERCRKEGSDRQRSEEWPPTSGAMVHAQHTRLEGQPRHGDNQARRAQPSGHAAETDSSNFWQSAEWLQCADGKQRRIEPSIRLLADGVPGILGRLRAYGNAIVPQAAAEFIKAFIDSEK